ETKEGEKRTVVELEVDEIGPSLRYATAKVNKVTRGETTRKAAGAVNDPWEGEAPPAGDGFADEPSL
ncbi:single-stranded DNA-binding protein, partial [Nocardia sp. NRRL S-836]